MDERRGAVVPPTSASPPLGVAAAEAISTQHEHLLNEVEAAEGQLGAILR